MSEIYENLTRRIIEEIFNKTNLISFSELISEEIIIHDTDKEIHGLKNLKAGLEKLHAAFPDLEYTIEDIFSEGKKL